MFFFMPTYTYILMAAAVIPAVILMRYVYITDSLERESPRILGKIAIGGVIATFAAMIIEWVGGMVLDIFFDVPDTTYYAWMYFAVVAPAEEGAKYYMLKKRSWNDPEFNCQYDGLVYAVFASLGFAIAENVEYVFMYGLGTAIIRAVTAIPGHACFGVFMGIWYGAAKRMENRGNTAAERLALVFALAMPIIIHGAYDFIATVGHNHIFIIFIAVMFIAAFKTVKWMSSTDRDITMG